MNENKTILTYYDEDDDINKEVFDSYEKALEFIDDEEIDDYRIDSPTISLRASVISRTAN